MPVASGHGTPKAAGAPPAGFWQSVPIRFHRNGAASSRSTSMPRLARANIVASMARKTAGLAWFRSHWYSWKVVQTQPSSGTSLKLPSA